jgi:Tol biopolymer transport system component
MSLDRFHKSKRLFEEALGMAEQERGAFLARACSDDAELRQEVESLLAFSEKSGGFLNRSRLATIPEQGSELAAPGASSRIGFRLGPYEVLALLGAGGMGEVYRARDTRLGREVAVKLLPEQFARDPERLRRFEGEARAASALSDPHIVAVFDVGEAEGVHFFASELVEGSDLRKGLEGGALPIRKALDLARQIASGLASAHDKGIIHRDLKPENVLITKAGLAKIADFGLAKFTEPGVAKVSNLPTSDGRRTQTGAIMGTVAYMSPEQVRGEALDHRSDIFSFGSVLYEMLTGRKAFERGTAAETMTAILKEEPQEFSESERVPPALARIVGHCLEKVPERRFHSLHDVVFALEEVGSLSSPRVAPLAHGKARRSRLAGGLALAAAAALVGALAAWSLMRVPRAVPVPALTLTRLTSDVGLTTEPALSRDGRMLAYASDQAGEGNLDIYVRQVGTGEPLRLTRDPADDHEPAFSRDGTAIAFRSERDGGGIYVVSALGGPARRIAPEGRWPQFSPDGNWIAYWVGGVYGGAGGVYGASLSIRDLTRICVVPSAGGQPRRLRSDFAAASYPVWTPDGAHLLFLGNRDEKLPMEDSLDWWVTPLDDGPAIKTGALAVTRQAKLTGPLQVYPWALFAPTWEPQGDSLVFSATAGDTTNLWRIGLSPKTWKVTGPPQRLTSGTTIERSPSVAFGSGGVVRLAFATLIKNLAIWSLPIDPNRGRVTGELKRLTHEATDDFYPSISADRSKMLHTSSRSGSQEIWIRDLKSGEDSVLTASRVPKVYAVFSADGSKVAFFESPSWNVYIVPSAGGAPEMVCAGCGEATGWTSDGKRIIGNTVDGQAWVLDLASRRRTSLLATRHWIATGGFSPDGRWFAFGDHTANRGYVAPFRAEGSIPESSWIALDADEWSPDGRLGYFRSNRDGFNCIWARHFDPATERPVGEPFAVFHSHNARISLSNQDGFTMAAGSDQLLFNMGEHTGNIWMAEWKPQ